MTPAALRAQCREDGLYGTPALNERLFLHYKGWARIASLEAYTGLRALYLEGNGLSRMEGLARLAELRVLYLQENLIEEVEGLEGCVSGGRRSQRESEGERAGWWWAPPQWCAGALVPSSCKALPPTLPQEAPPPPPPSRSSTRLTSPRTASPGCSPRRWRRWLAACARCCWATMRSRRLRTWRR